MVLKVLLVGTGLTSSLIGNFIRKQCQKPLLLITWDKARGTGGRMSTSRHPSGSGEVDLGAQYITCLPENKSRHFEVYKTLLDNHVIEPLSARVVGLRFPEGTEHYVAPKGMSSVVKHLLKDVFDEINFNRRVVSLLKVNGQWLVECEAGQQELFDIVIITIPVPQILQLSGTVNENITQNINLGIALKSVKFSSRYALGLFYAENITINEQWDVKYIYDDSIFRYAAVDNMKRNQPDRPTTAVLHTSVQYGEENVERNIGDVQCELMQHFKTVFPHWPVPETVKCHKWRYSQVVTPYLGTPGFVTIEEEPLLLAGGDSFTKSTFDGCIESAELVSRKVVETINTRSA
ncbi:LOW QUALITY PROTEIN: renalase-like [Bacillus rossius redtenbacheri]|uniref:LOW QUALITY PROTEIN: renalase-like n=1 Tax=Bacillus rossius redtenbacheri TaxID=93214 RepID=UPI002FDDD53D